MHARQKGDDIVSKPNFAVQIIEISVSALRCGALPRGAVGMHNTGANSSRASPPLSHIENRCAIIRIYDTAWVIT